MFNFTKSLTETDLNRAKIKLNLKITDFKKQHAVKIGLVVALIDRLPAYHLTQLREITYDPRQLTIQNPDERLGHTLLSAKGVYLQHKRMVAIFDTEDQAVFRHTLYHEIGHHVYFVVIGQELKHTWVTAICRYDSFITDYASVNAAEDFAESYVNYLLAPNELMSIPLKFHFMQEYVFRTKMAVPKPEKLNILI